MAFNAWVTSDELIEAIQRKISMPLAQGLMSAQDILDFATEELLISQVPSVMQYHEEYFVWQDQIPLVQGKSRYPIPERAIGMKLRNVWYKDSGGNLFQMTRINPEDKAQFQNDSAGAYGFQRYYLQGNYIVLSDGSTQSDGTFQFEYFIRPNRLVPNARAAYIESFFKQLTVDNSALVAGDMLTIGSRNFIADTDFAIGVDSVTTASNLVTALNASGLLLSTDPSSAQITMNYDSLETGFSVSNPLGLILNSWQGVEFTDTLPSNFVAGLKVDFLQTRPGHSLRGKEVLIPATGLSTTSILFNTGTVPTDTEIGDYIALAGEAIIPQIPTDLHTSLGDRACARILAAIGDKDGVDQMNQKLTETETRQGTLLNNRVEGSLPRVVARSSLLRQGKIGVRRTF